jgi:gentisate 1,2-dioxygenase
MSVALKTSHTVDVDYHELCGALAARSMQPLWRMERHLVPEVPLPTAVPWLWKWDTILPLAQRAGEVVTLERGGDRRVLALANPGLGGLPFTSSTLWGAIQYLGPHEQAPPHRHTPGAIRFVMSGSGATTTVNGDVCTMEPGDLVLTPNWHWHEHHSDSDEPVVWFDGLDLPLASTLEGVFFENHPTDRQEVLGRDSSVLAAPAVGVRPMGTAPAPPAGMLRYAWEDTDRALTAIAQASDDPVTSIEYTDPRTGGPVLPTLGCEMHRLRPGRRTSGRRATGSVIYVVFRGRGTSVVNGQSFAWSAGDVFVVPSWAIVDHTAEDDADLFALTDRPVLETLGLYRGEILAEPQPITTAFEPFVEPSS